MKVTVLISGRGSNLHALLEAQENYTVSLVISDKNAPGLQHALDFGVPYHIIDEKRKSAFEEKLNEILLVENPRPHRPCRIHAHFKHQFSRSLGWQDH